MQTDPENELVERLDEFMRVIVKTRGTEVARWTKTDLSNAIKWTGYIENIGRQYDPDQLLAMAQAASDNFHLPPTFILEPRRFLLECLINNPAVTPLLLELIADLDKEVPALVLRQARFLSELAQLREATSTVGGSGGLAALSVCADHLRLAWESLAEENSPDLERMESYLLSAAHVDPDLAAILLRCLQPGSKHIEAFLLKHRDVLPLFELPPQLLAEACAASPSLLSLYCQHLETKVAGLPNFPPFVARTWAGECWASLRPLSEKNLISGDFPALHHFLRTWQG